MQNLLHELFLSSYKTKQSFKDNISEDIQFSTQKYNENLRVFFLSNNFKWWNAWFWHRKKNSVKLNVSLVFFLF